jgi:hypothetical protein
LLHQRGWRATSWSGPFRTVPTYCVGLARPNMPTSSPCIDRKAKTHPTPLGFAPVRDVAQAVTWPSSTFSAKRCATPTARHGTWLTIKPYRRDYHRHPNRTRRRRGQAIK